MFQSLIQQAQSGGTPIIQEDGSVTFVWQGRDAPRLIGDFTDWEDGKPLRLGRAFSGLWTLTLNLPQDAYIEYTYVRYGQIIPDPLNPRLVSNGLGDYNNFFYMPGAAPTPLAKRVKGVPRGSLTRYDVPTDDFAVHKFRSVYLYQPVVSEPCPLLVVWDGHEYLQRASLITIVDNLIAQKRIRPLAMALVNAGGQARSVEYMCSEATLSFLLSTVLPLAIENLNLLDIQAAPGAYGILGASLGGLMALFTGIRLPHIFGHVLSQSGAFAHDEREYVVYNLISCGAPLPLKIWMDVGKFEDLVQANQRMASLLSSKGYPVAYQEYPGGHNYSSWRNEVWKGLEFLFGANPT